MPRPLATIDELTKDDQRLVRQVATLGRRLQQQLRQLQSEYPLLVADIRGRGLMIGVDLDLDTLQIPRLECSRSCSSTDSCCIWRSAFC